jgi:hypothetical protein
LELVRFQAASKQFGHVRRILAVQTSEFTTTGLHRTNRINEAGAYFDHGTHVVGVLGVGDNHLLTLAAHIELAGFPQTRRMLGGMPSAGLRKLIAA